MRKTIIVASTAFLCAGAASAGEMSVGKMQASYDNPAMRWAGPYTGAAAGFSWGKVKDDVTEIEEQEPAQTFGLSQSKTTNGASYGGYAGHNWVSSNVVYGLEANFNSATMNATLLQSGEPIDYRNEYVYQTTHDVTWYGTAVGRIGVAQGPLLLYVNGGVVLGNDKSTFTISIVDDGIYSSNHSNTTHWGWTAGVGFEYAITDLLSTRVEFNHVDYADKTVIDGRDKADVHFETVKLGLTVKITQ